jgi:hypothetical protein
MFDNVQKNFFLMGIDFSNVERKRQLKIDKGPKLHIYQQPLAINLIHT